MNPVIQHFDDTAERYQNALLGLGARNVTELSYAYMEAVRLWRHTNPDISLLDVCIGTGATSQLLLHSKYDVHGVDGSPKMLDLAVKNGFDRDKLTLADVTTNLPFPDASFAVVLTSDSLFYLQNATKVASEMFRVAKPGGLVLVDPIIHKNNKKGTIECVHTRPDTLNIPPVYVQNANAFDKACRAGGGSRRQVVHSSTRIAEVIKCPIPARQVAWSFIKK